MIHEILGHGAKNRITTKDLQARFNMPARQIVEQVSRERSQKHCILSLQANGGGYFLPADDPAEAMREMEACVRAQQSKALNTLKAVQPIKNELKRMKQEAAGQGRQMTLEDFTTTEPEHEKTDD